MAQSVPRRFRDDLYFIQADSGPIKIGRAKDAQKRIANLQIGAHEELTLLEVLVGRGYEEKVWHKAFRDARRKGEWFNPTEELEWAILYAARGKRWWDHLTPPASVALSDDPDERDDDIVDWHIAVHLALAEAAERDGLTAIWGGRALCMQDNGDEPFQC